MFNMLINREIQINTTLRFHLNLSDWLRSIKQVIAHAGDDVEKGEYFSKLIAVTSCTVSLEMNIAVPQKISHPSADSK